MMHNLTHSLFLSLNNSAAVCAAPDSRQSSCAQLPALELLSHLCGMASTWEAPSFPLTLVRSLAGVCWEDRGCRVCGERSRPRDDDSNAR